MSVAAPQRGGMILATLILGAAVANLNLSVANVVLPTIGRDLNASQTALNLIAVGFTLGLAASVLYLGAVADRYGRRKMLLLGLALSIPAAALAAWAPNIEILALARLIGGVAAGMAYPTTLSMVSAIFSGKGKTKAIALWSGVGGGASALGPAVAGYLIEDYWWGSAFIITIPVAVVALILAFVVLPRRTGEEDAPVDHLGGVLSVLAIGSLTLGLHFVAVPGELWLGLMLLAGAGIGFAVFAFWERRASNPLFDLMIAKRPTFWVAALAGMIVFGSLVGSMFVGQQYLQNVLAYSPFEAGIAILPAAIVMILVSPIAARMIDRRGGRVTMAIGFVAVLLGFVAMFAWREGASYVPVGIAYGLIGLGVGFAGAPASHSLMASVPVRRAGMGSGMTDLQRDLGAAIMQSLLGAFLTVRYVGEISGKLANLPAAERSQVTEQTAATLQSSFGGAVVLAEQYPNYASQIIAAARDAFITGSAAAIIAAFVAVTIGLVLIVLAFPRKARQETLEAEYALEQ